MTSTHASSSARVSTPSTVFRESRRDAATEICPLCEQPIPPQKLVEIQQRECQRAKEQKQQLRSDFDREKTAALAEKDLELDQFKKKAAADAKHAQRETEKLEAAARLAGKKAAGLAMSDKLKAVIEEKAAMEDQLKTVKAEEERASAERLEKALAEQRGALEKASTEAVQKEQSKAFEERQKMQSNLENLQRQIKKERADELGEAAELDLTDALREAFPLDRFHPIDKGVAGADLWQDVKHTGEVCGRIVYDSKNRNQWRNTYVSKLKTDQLDANGDYAVLATRIFPAGCKQLSIKDSVFVVHPARVVFIATILRDFLIQTYRLKLSNEERAEKINALYEFITSERCHKIFDNFETLTADMLELDAKETKQHQTNWKKRGEMIRKAERTILVQLRGEIERTIEYGMLS